MLRSFSYAAYAGLNAFTQRRPPTTRRTRAISKPGPGSGRTPSRPSSCTPTGKSVSANPQLIPQPPQAQRLLKAYLLEKSLYELLYELNNRPAWVRIPLAGILSLFPAK